MRQTSAFRDLAKEMSGIAVGTGPETDSYIFGGTPNDGHWPINPIIARCQRADVTGSTDAFSQFNAYPVRVKTGASETDRTTTQNSYDFSGIGFKGSQGAYVTNIPLRKRVNFTLETLAAGVSMSSGIFSLYATTDGGYTISMIYQNGINSGAVSSADFAPTDITTVDATLIFRVDNNGDTSTKYRKFVRGLITLSDW